MTSTCWVSTDIVGSKELLALPNVPSLMHHVPSLMHHLQVARLPCLPRLPHLSYALAVWHVVLAGAYSFFVFFSLGYVYFKMI